VAPTTRIYVVRDAWSPDLQLHVRCGPGSHTALFGWDVEPPPVDAGPPPLVEGLLARALVAVGPLAVLSVGRAQSTEGWSADGEDRWLALGRSLGDRIRGLPPLALVATRDATRARTLFSGDLSWSQQAAAGYLLGDGEWPPVSRALVARVMDARDADLADLALPDGVRALALPAVDGDYLQLAASDPEAIDAVAAALSAACADAGVPFEVRADWR